MYLVDADSAPYDSTDKLLSGVVNSSQYIHSQMSDDETLWILCSNQYDRSGCRPVPLEAADSIQREISLTLKNTVTVHATRDAGGELNSIYKEILLFVKNKKEYKFNKNNIRVSHIYKGNEWGEERKEGTSGYHDTEVRRYNPDGRDPGNVWTEEDRTITGGKNVDKTCPIALNEAVERCVLAGSAEDEIVHTLWMSPPGKIAGRQTRPMKLEVE